MGACVQRLERGALGECICVGYAALEPVKRPVAPDTIFRTASVAKMVTALLVFRLQTLGRLSVAEDVGDLLGRRVRNPHCPEAPITLGMLLSHTSGIVDSAAYFAAFGRGAPLSELLEDPRSYLPAVPGTTFRYSNLGAGMVASLLEKRFDVSFEALIERELLEPLGVMGTFDPSGLDAADVADSYRVLPASRAFCAAQRIASAEPMKNRTRSGAICPRRATCLSPRRIWRGWRWWPGAAGTAFWTRGAWRRCAAPWRDGLKRP